MVFGKGDDRMLKETMHSEIKKLVYKCLEKGITIDGIADAMDVNRATVYRWFSGYAMPNALAYVNLKELCADKDTR